MAKFPNRIRWPAEFPDVVIHTDVRTRDAHKDYSDAKAGDADAALALALELISERAVRSLRELIGDRNPLVLPVVADETMGFNAIPDAMAQLLGRFLHVPVQ
jgi:hypothetical protein